MMEGRCSAINPPPQPGALLWPGMIADVAAEEGLLRPDVHTSCTPPPPPTSRVQFRADVLQQRREEREALEQERQREEEERRRRLEVLRNQVDHYLLLTFPATLICSVSPKRASGDRPRSS